jgi:hypothetical protein
VVLGIPPNLQLLLKLRTVLSDFAVYPTQKQNKTESTNLCREYKNEEACIRSHTTKNGKIP